MGRAFTLVGCGLLITFLLAVARGQTGVGGGGGLELRANLDLPFNAAGSSEEEEQAPEIIFLYGGMYEADAVVFCLDESLSMKKHSRWELQVREVTRAIMNLSEKTEFGMVFYGASAYPFRKSLLAADPGAKSAAVAFLQSRKLTLGTCTGPGVLKSLELLQRATRNHRTVIVVGDGRPTRCPFTPGSRLSDAEESQLVQQSVQANPGLKVRIHTIFVGQDNDPRATQFMRRLATTHRGTFRAVTR